MQQARRWRVEICFKLIHLEQRRSVAKQPVQKEGNRGNQSDPEAWPEELSHPCPPSAHVFTHLHLFVCLSSSRPRPPNKQMAGLYQKTRHSEKISTQTVCWSPSPQGGPLRIYEDRYVVSKVMGKREPKIAAVHVQGLQKSLLKDKVNLLSGNNGCIQVLLRGWMTTQFSWSYRKRNALKFNNGMEARWKNWHFVFEK